MKPLVKINKAVIVEGKYDKIRLANIIDAVIITTDGFGVFKNADKKAFIRLMAEKNGIVILTDSDSAGQMIRKHVEKIAGKDKVCNVYLPQILGKEKRKTTFSAEGFLGVEGTDDQIILETLKKAGVTCEKTTSKGRKITKTDLFNIGVSGGEGSKTKRASLLSFLNLPSNLPANSMLDAINTLFDYESFMEEVEKWNRESAQN